MAKVFHYKKLWLGVSILVLAFGLAFVLAKYNILTPKKTVKILSHGFSVCTMDVPTSSCGPYEVKVQSLDGEQFVYKVNGFDNGRSEEYRKITSRITSAKEQSATVEIKTNYNGYIIEVE